MFRVYGERFVSRQRHRYVALAMADRVELEDQYSELIFVFGAAALVALLYPWCLAIPHCCISWS